MAAGGRGVSPVALEVQAALPLGQALVASGPRAGLLQPVAHTVAVLDVAAAGVEVIGPVGAVAAVEAREPETLGVPPAPAEATRPALRLVPPRDAPLAQPGRRRLDAQ